MSTNKLVTCPYDEAHKVKESRLQLHISKCKRNRVTEKDKYVCKFNALHILDKGEAAYHELNCPDKARLDRLLSTKALDKNNPLAGNATLPICNEFASVITEELWDVDIDTSGRGYMPSAEAPVGAIIEPPPYSKPAERKKLYQELHRQPNQRDTQPPQSVPAPVTPKEPKQPTEASKVEKLRRQNVQQYQNLGLGRGSGVPPPATSRIAANFFASTLDSNQQPPSQPSARSYSSAISTGMNQLGLSRGNINKPVDTLSTFPDNSEDFPALGLGRGTNKRH